MSYLIFTLFGYLSGSILYAFWVPKLVCSKDVRREGKDGNPGTANVYLTCGVFWGTVCLLLELGKGFFPVFTALHVRGIRPCSVDSLLFVPVLTAPVLGHAAPFFSSKKGGKAIAVSFGVLLGLFPACEPAVILASFYLTFSLLVIISPHLFRSVVTFFLTALCVYLTCSIPSIRVGCAAIACIVIWKHLKSYDGEKCRVRLFLRRSSS